jgi:hypothetical protein
VTFSALDDRLWYLALAFGGLSVVATTIAWHSWRLTPDNGDVPFSREWDFRYWLRIGQVTAGLSILFSLLWLIA